MRVWATDSGLGLGISKDIAVEARACREVLPVGVSTEYSVARICASSSLTTLCSPLV